MEKDLESILDAIEAMIDVVVEKRHNAPNDKVKRVYRRVGRSLDRTAGVILDEMNLHSVTKRAHKERSCDTLS